MISKFLTAILVTTLCTFVSSAEMAVSVLPIISTFLDDDSRLYLADTFRQYLRDSDSFTVMTRRFMKEILTEQEFQMSESCDQTSCMVRLGKLVGAQSIVSLIIIKNGRRCYSASCKLISVETGEIVAQAMETRTGEKYATIERMLRNIAFAIAGKPTKDHTMFLSEQEKISEKRAQKFKTMLHIQGSLPILILTEDPNIPRQKFYDTDTTIRAWGLPEKEFNYGLGCGFSMKLHEKVWLRSLLSFNQSSECREFISWDETLEDKHLNTISHMGIYHMMADVSLGLEMVLFKSSRFQFSFTTMPLAGYGKKCFSSNDTTIVTAKEINENQYTGQTTLYRYTNSETLVDGFITGGDIGVSSSLHLKTNWSFDISLNTRCILAPELQGETAVRQKSIMFSPLHPNGEVSDSTWSYRSAAVQGDFLGTGEFIKIGNPDEKISTDNEHSNIPYRKSIFEFSAVELRIGISYYF